MSVPVYISSGTATNTPAVTAPTPSWPATSAPGYLAILVTEVRGDVSGTLTPPADNWTLIGSRLNFNSNDSLSAYWRPMTGTESGTITVATTGAAGRRIAHIHMFTGDSSGWHIEDADGENSPATQTTISDNNVTTLGADRLAINIVGYTLSGITVQEVFVGETGGTWVERAFYSHASQQPTISLHTANMPSAGLIGGGVATVATTSSIVLGFAIWSDPPTGEPPPPPSNRAQPVVRGFHFTTYSVNELIDAQNGPRLDAYRTQITNATHAVLAVHVTVPNTTSNVVYLTSISEDPTHLAAWFDLVYSRGLKPGLIITLFSDNAFGWGGLWNPSNPAAALASYYTAVQPYVQAAEAAGLEFVILASEWSTLFSNVATVTAFTTLQAAARADFSGDIMWNVAWLNEDDIRPEIVALADKMGISAFVASAIVNSPTIAQMFTNLTGTSQVVSVQNLVTTKRTQWGDPDVVGYMSFLRVLAERWGKPIVTTAGYKSTVGSARDPFYQPETTADNAAQANAWQAFIDAALDADLGINNGLLHGMLAFRWWPSTVDADGTTGFSVQDKLASSVINVGWTPEEVITSQGEAGTILANTVSRHGTFGGIDANARNYNLASTGTTPFWTSITSAPPWAQRDGLIVVRQINQVGDGGGADLVGIGTFSSRPEWLSMRQRMKFSLLNNCELEVVNPCKNGDQQAPVTCVATIGTGDDALVWHETTKPLNIRWRLSVMANAYPGAFPLSAFIPGNEPDGNVQRYIAYGPAHVGGVVGPFSNAPFVDRTEALRRLAVMARAAYEELKTDKRVYTKQKHPGILPTYANTGAGMQNLNPPGGINYSAYHFYTYNNGEFLNYFDVVANHFHNLASAFDTSGVPNNRQSPWHLWTAIHQGQALAGTGMVHPIYCNEGGVRESTLPASQQSQWNFPETSANLLARRLLKARRTGMMLCTLFYWAYSLWILYNHNASGDDGMLWCPASAGFAPREPPWTAVRRQFDPDLYMMSGRPPWLLPITAKPWADLANVTTQATVGFHDPATWAILGNFYDPEKADPASATVRTWYEWDRATVGANLITFTAPVSGQGNQINRAMRPVILPGHGTYYVSCTVSGNTGTARLIARGYNSVDGLATTAGQSGSETTSVTATLTAKFTTVPHDVKHFPNLPKAAIVLESTSAARFSDVAVSPRPIGDITIVAPPPPPLVVTATASPLSGQAPLAVSFGVSVTGGSGGNTYSWVFGDGGTASVASVVHTYATAGTYTPSVTVFSASQSASDSTSSITVTSVTTTRQAELWPFSSNSPWNRPIGSSANLVDYPIIRTSGPSINLTSWSIVVSLYNAANPLVTITQLTTCGAGGAFDAAPPAQRIPAGMTGAPPVPPACYRDGFLASVHSDKRVYGFTRFTRTSNTAATASYHKMWSDAEDHSVIGTGWKSSIGWPRGGHWIAGSSLIAGLMRSWEIDEIQSGSRTIMNHVLQATLPATMLKTRVGTNQSTTYVWPAVWSDGDGSGYSGTVPLGSLLTIPSSFNIEATAWTAQAKALARTIQKYGVYLVGQGGDALLFYVEQGANQTCVNAMKTNLAAIRDQMRVVSNNSPSAIGGGGTYPAALWPIPDPV